MNNLEKIVGVDLCEGVSQLSYFDMEKMEPGSETEIPTLLCRLPDGSWLAGEEARIAGEKGEGLVLSGFLADLSGQPRLEAGQETFDKAELAARFLCACLTRQLEETSAAYLTVTAREITPAFTEALLAARAELGVEETAFSIMSHTLSAEFFALSQKRELWMHDVGIFEYDEEGLRYEHLSISGQKHPAIVRAQIQDLRSFLDGSELTGGSDTERDAAFMKALKAAAGEASISTFYLVGKGFQEVGEGSSWMNHSLLELTAKRRHVFVGRNFYVKGACYNSYYMAMPKARPEFVAADTELTTGEVFLYIVKKGKLARLPLIPLQTAWFTAAGTAAVLPAGSKTLTIGVQNAVTGETHRFSLDLEGMPDRPEKTTKLQVHARYEEEQLLHVTVKDMGFGDIFPASEQMWEKTFALDAQEEAGLVKSAFAEAGAQILETVLPGASVPLKIPRTGIKVYAYDELCWYVRENVSALDREFFNESLFMWLDEITGSTAFSDSLRRMKEDGRSMTDLVRYLLSASDYVTPAEMKSAASALAIAQKQDPAARAAVTAAYYYRYGRFMSAVQQYQHAIWMAEHDPEVMATRAFKSDLWHNMGIALLRLGDRQSAVRCLQKAFQENEDPVLVSECLAVYYMSGDEEAFRQLAEKYRLPESVLSVIREDCDQAGMAYEESPRAAQVEKILAAPGKEEVNRYIQELKSRFAI